MRILGVDPSSRQTGFGIIQAHNQDCEHLCHGRILTEKYGLPKTLKEIFDQLSAKLLEYKPQAVAVEGLFFAKNAHSALVLGHARGVVLLAAEQQAVPVFEYSPASIKTTLTGKGQAGKQQVQKMVQLLLGMHSKLSLDESDALAVAICHAQQLKINSLVQEADARLY